jgi:hypothetical protein
MGRSYSGSGWCRAAMFWIGTCAARLHILCRPQVECCDTDSLDGVPMLRWGTAWLPWCETPAVLSGSPPFRSTLHLDRCGECYCVRPALTSTLAVCDAASGMAGQRSRDTHAGLQHDPMHLISIFCCGCCAQRAQQSALLQIAVLRQRSQETALASSIISKQTQLAYRHTIISYS